MLLRFVLLLTLGEVSSRVPFCFTRQDAVRGALLFGAGDIVAQGLEHHVDGRHVHRPFRPSFAQHVLGAIPSMGRW